METKKGPYDDIIDLPHHVSPTRRRMSSLERAAQFSPFAALVGYDAAIREEARLTFLQRELAEDEKAELDRKYRLLSDHLEERPEVEVTFFQPDSRKSGGDYVTCKGVVLAVSAREQWLSLADGTRIWFRDIMKLESDIFDTGRENHVSV